MPYFVVFDDISDDKFDAISNAIFDIVFDAVFDTVFDAISNDTAVHTWVTWHSIAIHLILKFLKIHIFNLFKKIKEQTDSVLNLRTLDDDKQSCKTDSFYSMNYVVLTLHNLHIIMSN